MTTEIKKDILFTTLVYFFSLLFQEKFIFFSLLSSHKRQISESTENPRQITLPESRTSLSHSTPCTKPILESTSTLRLGFLFFLQEKLNIETFSVTHIKIYSKIIRSRVFKSCRCFPFSFFFFC